MNPFKDWTAADVANHNARVCKENRVPVAETAVNECLQEFDLHDQIINHCNGQWPRWKFIRARTDQRSTIAKGAQDFTLFLPGGRVMCIEVKSRNGKITTDQLGWAREMACLGHRVHVVRSFEEFLGLL